MFKDLLAALKSGDMLDKAFSQFDEMLDHAHWMFVRADEVLQRKVPPAEVRDSIYRRDQSINELLRSIRRKIVRHLTVNPGRDVAGCLALMSIAKDAERIGDYCKNVFEVGSLYQEDYSVPRYKDQLVVVQKRVADLFSAVRSAFASSNQRAANEAIAGADSMRAECDEVIDRLLQDTESMQTHQAVAYSLLARHYKRVAGHLSNIATAVNGKIEDLDFRR